MNQYPWLALYANLLRFLGYAVLAIGAIVGFSTALSAPSGGIGVGAFFAILFNAALIGLGILVVSELLILFMNVAQDVREARKQLDEMNALAKKQNP